MPQISTDAVAYHNGRVYTVNPAQPRAEAFIVSPDGIFSDVGSDEDILSRANEHGLPTYNLQGRFIMPGIHDAHVHALAAGLSLLSNAKPGMDSTTSNIAARMKSTSCACRYAHTYGDWLMGDLYRIEGYDHACLDEEFPDTPVVIRGGAGHALFLNAAALKQSGYSISDEPEAQHHQYFRHPDGSLTGEVTEMGMTKALLSLPKPGLAHVKRCLLHAISRLHRAGVTSFQEASANTVLLQALQQLESEQKLRMDIQTHIVYAPEYLAEESYSTLRPTLDAAPTFASSHVQTNYVKIILDGVPLHPYYTHAGLTSTGHIDEAKIQVDDLASAVARYDARGMTCKIHCTGQGSTRRALDVYQEVRQRHPSAGPRHEIAHCSGVHDDDYHRFAELNVTAEMSPSMFFVHPVTSASGGLMDWNFARMIAHGAHMTMGSDWAFQEDPGLLPACAAVMDQCGDDAAGKLLRMLTLSGAQAVGRENVTGSIAVGKKANFIMLDRDLSRGEFEGAQVIRTWFEGEVVWEVEGS